MNSLLLFLILIFVTINIIQTWLIFACKLLKKGAVIIGGMEAIEFPIVIFLIMKGGIAGFLTVVLVEVIQWLLIAYLSTNSKIK